MSIKLSRKPEPSVQLNEFREIQNRRNDADIRRRECLRLIESLSVDLARMKAACNDELDSATSVDSFVADILEKRNNIEKVELQIAGLKRLSERIDGELKEASYDLLFKKESIAREAYKNTRNELLAKTDLALLRKCFCYFVRGNISPQNDKWISFLESVFEHQNQNADEHENEAVKIAIELWGE